jgi:hypothetical protein
MRIRWVEAFTCILQQRQGNAAVSFNGNYGNPAIEFDSSIGANPNILIQLSTSNAATCGFPILPEIKRQGSRNYAYSGPVRSSLSID